jgi:anti-sigma regulatory factor (Ser/Thr protein kinase)
MEPVTFTVANELAVLPVLQAAAAAFVRAAGAEEASSYEIELVLEEIFTNILEHGYLPGQRECIQLTLGIERQFLVVSMRFRGIPFDVDYLQRCVEFHSEDMLNGSIQGIGLRLIRQFTNRIEYRNLGKEGQEIYILRELSTPEGSPTESVRTEKADKPEPQDFNICLRRMLPAEAPIVSKLAYFTYDYSYVYGHMYDPEKVRSLNEEGSLISFVVLHEENGIIGHFAISPDDRSDMCELCSGFVDPRFRRNGCMNAMGTHGLAEAQKLGAEGVFVIAVTTHPYSQKAALTKGLRETALFLSRVQPVAMRAIRDEAIARESFFFMVRHFGGRSWGPYYSPLHHRSMLERICRNMDVEAVFEDRPGDVLLPERGQIELKLDNYQAGHIFVHEFGRDTVSMVRTNLRRWQLDRVETIYLYLPLLQPGTATLCDKFEEMEFFFSGLRVGRGGKDWLVLQFLNNQRYAYDLLQAATSFGQELIDYVREHDPVRNF